MSAMGRTWRRLAAWWRAREAAPAGEAPWVARQVRDNCDALKAAAERIEALEAAMVRQERQRASSIEGVRRALDAAGVPVPECVTADADTQPIYLRAV